IGGFDQLFQWRPRHGTEVICVPIDHPDQPIRFTVDPFYQWHFSNAFTRGGAGSPTELVIDYCRYPDFGSFYEIGSFAAGNTPAALAEGRWHRATIDLAAKRFRSEQLFDRACEFPKVAPSVEGAESRYAYATLGDLEAIGKID